MRQTISLSSQPPATATALEAKTKQEDEEAAVFHVIKALLDAVSSKDAAKMLAHCLPTGSAARMRGGEMQVGTLAELCEEIRVLQGEVWEGFVGAEVRVYNDLAMVWARNEIEIDGQLVAVGCNVMSLHKMAGEWKITSVSDTSHPPPEDYVRGS